MTEQMDTMSKSELLEKCKELGITKCNSKNKSQLIELITSKQKIPMNEALSPPCQNVIISTDNIFHSDATAIRTTSTSGSDVSTPTSPGRHSNWEPALRVLSAKHPLKLVVKEAYSPLAMRYM